MPQSNSDEVKTYTALDSVAPFHASAAHTKALCGPVGSGKSLAAGMEFFLLGMESPVPVNGVVFRESYRQLHDSTLKTLQHWFPEPLAKFKKTNETLEFTFPGADGIVRQHDLAFRHGRRESDASNLMSTEFGFAWFEEVVPAFEVTGGVIGGGLPKGLYDLLLTRMRQPGMHRRQVLLTFNPPSTFHWVYKMFFMPTRAELAANGIELFRQPPRENEAHLPADYYDALLRRLDPELARRFVLGEPVTLYPGRRVYPEAYESLHFADSLEPTPGIPLVIGFDYGLTPVALIGQVLPSTRLQVYREVQLWDAGAEQLGIQLEAELKDERFRKFKKWRCWGDPMGNQRSQADVEEKTAVQVLARHGFDVQPGATAFGTRREAVKHRLSRSYEGKPAVLIDRHGCPTLTEGLLGGYRYPKGRDERIGTMPIKNSQFSHVANAFEYIVTGEFSAVDGEFLQTDANKPEQASRLPFWDPLKAPRQRRPGSWISRMQAVLPMLREYAPKAPVTMWVDSTLRARSA